MNPEAAARIRAGEPQRRGTAGETVEEVAARFAPALQRAVEDADPSDTVVVATHGLAARVGVCLFLGIPQAHWPAFGGLSNCNWISLLPSRNNNWRIEEWNAGSLPEPVMRTTPNAEPSAVRTTPTRLPRRAPPSLPATGRSHPPLAPLLRRGTPLLRRGPRSCVAVRRSCVAVLAPASRSSLLRRGTPLLRRGPRSCVAVRRSCVAVLAPASRYAAPASRSSLLRRGTPLLRRGPRSCVAVRRSCVAVLAPASRYAAPASRLVPGCGLLPAGRPRSAHIVLPLDGRGRSPTTESLPANAKPVGDGTTSP